MQERAHIKMHDMRSFMCYVHLAFAGTAKYELLKEEIFKEYLLAEPHLMIFPSVLYIFERCGFYL